MTLVEMMVEMILLDQSVTSMYTLHLHRQDYYRSIPSLQQRKNNSLQSHTLRFSGLLCFSDARVCSF